MRILYFSDPHIDARTAGVERWPEFERFLEWFIEQIRVTGADHVLVGGDYFDPGKMTDLRNSARLVSVATRIQEALPDDGVSIWIAGNHDVVNHADGSTTLSPLRAAQIPGVIVIENHSQETLLRLGQHAVLGLPYLSASLEESSKRAPWTAAREWLASNDGYLVILSHYDLPGAVMGSESHELARGRHVDYPVDEVSELHQQFPGRLVLLNGHYHKPQVTATTPPIHVPGSPLRLDFGERNDGCGILLIEMENSN